MAEWKKICCALDFSEFSRLAMGQAADLARKSAGSLTLVHVYEAKEAASGEMLVSLPELLPQMAREVEVKLEPWRREAEFVIGRPVETKVLTGNAAEAIQRFAQEGAFDLIVLGTHGRSGLKRLVLGSVAERVVRLAHCPVLVMRGPSAATPHQPVR